MNQLLDQLYKAKLRLAGLVTAVVGVGFLFLSKAVATTATLSWLVGWPTNELGTTLLSAGVIAVIFEYYARREADERATAHFRQAIRQEAPAIRDAVLDSFAFEPETMRSIASEKMLDRIATNAIGLRLGDVELAHDAYADLREQVVRSPERWHNVDVSVSLSPWEGGPAKGKDSMFVATIRWEYEVRPTESTLRFVSTSDQAEYRELLRDPTVADQWMFEKVGTLDASSQDTFELVQFTIDGEERPIRRTVRRGAQVYTVALGKAATIGNEVTVSYTYRILAQCHGHLLYLDLPRPTKGLHVQLNYGQADIRYVNVLDYFASPEASRVERSPTTAPAKTVDVGFDGWVFPRAGVAFVWVLEDELTRHLIKR
ncbi:hypothetical protein ACFWY9_10400 [Amycolatopsis sp. NPDC059027]|uniref:hypothetical protein n=1 Tax=Amycolatopsis sp. NPDC059027 TaxID=3346709 RepID=UPI00366E046C